uniref:Uncharacterized protein n=1 Tax=Oryza meridionalis TaxID=40149 RepID=A0A0E0CGB6_9ORYZ
MDGPPNGPPANLWIKPNILLVVGRVGGGGGGGGAPGVLDAAGEAGELVIFSPPPFSVPRPPTTATLPSSSAPSLQCRAPSASAADPATRAHPPAAPLRHLSPTTPFTLGISD